MDNYNCSDQRPNILLQLFESNQIDELKQYIQTARADRTFNTHELIDLAKSSKEAATLVVELINLNQVDETDLADKIAKEIMHDIEKYIDAHLNKYHKYTLNAPQITSNSDGGGSRAKFFNLISLLRDVSILGRKLLEASPRFESFKPSSPQISGLNAFDKKSLLASVGGQHRDSKSQMSEEEATSEDLLAALVESSSSDDFLVLSSSLESITIRDMIIVALILITSHECFTLSHDIQGVVMVLRRTKFLIKNILAPKNQMELVAKLLTSIRRYNEMNYAFDLFRDKNQFEILLSKGVEKTPELRIALFNYVKRNPEFYALVTLNFSMFREIAESLEASANKRLDKLIMSRNKKKMKKKVSLVLPATATDGASGFKSVSATTSTTTTPNAIAVGIQPQQQQQQEHEQQQQQKQDKGRDDDGVEHSSSSSSKPSTSGPIKKSNSIATSLSGVASGPGAAHLGLHHDVSNNKPLYPRDSLNLCLVELADASDCYAKAGCYKRSNNCEHRAKLVALQLALLQSETNVLDLQQSELNDLIVSFESFSSAYIVAEAYGYHFAWRHTLFRNVVLRGQSNYLDEFCMKCDLSQALVMELVFLYKQYIANTSNHLGHEEMTKLASSMKLILARLEDVEIKYKLYNQLNFVDAKEELLQNVSIQAHLKDLKLV